MQFYEMSAREIAAGVREKKFSATEVFEACLSRVQQYEDKLSALVTIATETGRAQAKRVDEKIAKGENAGLLAGVPVVVKDNICTHGVRTTASSRVLGDWAPPYDATVWALLAAEGAALIGKSGMDEFGTGISGKSAFSQIANPWDTSRTPGGSSGGSAAAVAAGYAPLALGSDTGGSIRLPAAFCGIYGLKPTYGLLSRYGLIAYGSSFDQAGPFVRCMDDMALAAQILGQHDPKDPTSISKKEINFAQRSGTLKGKKIAIVKEFMAFPLDQPVVDAMKNTVRLFEEAGAEIVEVSLPTVTRYAIPCYDAIVRMEAQTNLARFDGVRYGHTATAAGMRDMFETVRSEGFGLNAKYRILAGTLLTQPDCYEEYYMAAKRVRTLIAEEFRKTFEGAGKSTGKIDCILQPVSPSLPGKIGESMGDEKGYALDLYTLSTNVAGLPGFSFRAGEAKESPASPVLPVGLQLIGPRWSDENLLDIGFELEKILGVPKLAKLDKNTAL